MVSCLGCVLYRKLRESVVILLSSYRSLQKSSSRTLRVVEMFNKGIDVKAIRIHELPTINESTQLKPHAVAESKIDIKRDHNRIEIQLKDEQHIRKIVVIGSWIDVVPKSLNPPTKQNFSNTWLVKEDEISKKNTEKESAFDVFQTKTRWGLYLREEA